MPIAAATETPLCVVMACCPEIFASAPTFMIKVESGSAATASTAMTGPLMLVGRLAIRSVESVCTAPAMPPEVSVAVLSGAAPAAEAVALTIPSDAPCAENETEPPATMPVEVVARTSSSVRLSASAAPTAALPPTAAPLASVASVATCRAATVTLPFELRPPTKAPTIACVSLLTSEMAATGVTPTLPPDEPWSACVTTAWFAVAVRVTLPTCSPAPAAPAAFTPSMVAPSSRRADELVAVTLSAKEAPTPTAPVDDDPSPSGSAVTTEED